MCGKGMNMMKVCGRMLSEARLEKIGAYQSTKGQFTIKYFIFREIGKIPCVVQIFPVLYLNSLCFPCLEKLITKFPVFPVWLPSCYFVCVCAVIFSVCVYVPLYVKEGLKVVSFLLNEVLVKISNYLNTYLSLSCRCSMAISSCFVVWMVACQEYHQVIGWAIIRKNMTLQTWLKFLTNFCFYLLFKMQYNKSQACLQVEGTICKW